MPQDRGLERPQLGARLDAELLDEQPPAFAVALEGFRLPPAAVESEHQLTAQELSQWVRGHGLLQLGNERSVLAEREPDCDPLLECNHPQLVQPALLDSGVTLEIEVGQRRSPPQAEGDFEVAERVRVLAGGLGSAPPVEQSLEGRRIERVRAELEGVTGCPGRDHGRLSERPAHARHVHLNKVACAGWRRLSPQTVDESLDRHGLARTQEQDGEKCALTATSDPQALAVDRHGEWPEDREFDLHLVAEHRSREGGRP